MRLLPIVASLLLAAMPALAAKVEPATEQQLLALYDGYRKAVLAGKFDAAMVMMSAELKAKYRQQTRTEKDRREALTMAKMMMPETVSVVHSFVDAPGTHARLVTLATKTVPKDQKLPPGAPAPGTVMRGGITLAFVKEAGAWKFDQQTFGADPTVVMACKSETPDPESEYDMESNLSAGGPVARVEFKPDYTLVVFSVVGEANCAFLPTREALAKSGLNTDMLVPYAIVSIDGSRHKTDAQKILVDKIEVTAEE